MLLLILMTTLIITWPHYNHSSDLCTYVGSCMDENSRIPVILNSSKGPTQTSIWALRPPLLNGRCTSLFRAPVSEMAYTVSSGT